MNYPTKPRLKFGPQNMNQIWWTGCCLKLLRLGVACYIVTDSLKRRLKAPVLGVLHFLPLCENFCVRVSCYAWLISIYSHHGSFFVTHTTARRLHSGGFSIWDAFFFSSQRRIPGQKELAHTMARVQECVCLLIAVWAMYVSLPDFIFCPQWNLFLLVWTRETISRQSRVYCFCFWPVVWLEPSAFSAGVGIVPSSRVGYAARRVSWKWSFYYLRSASKPVVPTLRLSQAWRKLIVPTLCSTAHQNPAPASRSSASVGEKPV